MLELCRLFFENLPSQNVRYCHWKSNGHLKQALTGQTDLDVLIHEEDKEAFNQALQQFNFLEIISPPDKRFPYLEDYLGFDTQTGDLIHLHVHYKLLMGQRFIKNHHLPLESLFFDNLIVKDGIYIPRPELELILLVIRAGMKVEFISLIKHAIKDVTAPGYTAFPFEIEQEFKALIADSDMDILYALLHATQLPISPAIFKKFIAQFQNKSLKFYDLIILNRNVLSALKDFRRDTHTSTVLRYYWLLFRSLKTINTLFPAKKKSLVNRGFSFSIVGADGSGKSTLTEDLRQWLAWKLVVNPYYYGIPKTAFINFLDFSNRQLKKLSLPFVNTPIICLLWVYVAKGRYSISQQIVKKVANKEIAITDRFPLKDFQKMDQPMDGPRLQTYPESSPLCTKIESTYYDKIIFPRRIFVLQVTLDELRKRKTDLNIATHQIKADAVNALTETDNITIIDANQPYAVVCLTVKRQIWDLLTTEQRL